VARDVYRVALTTAGGVDAAATQRLRATVTEEAAE
jgi:hypothetical protein